MEMNCREAMEAVDGTLLQAGNITENIARVMIDSREATAGDFFIPLPGERTDGHLYIADTAQKGALGCFAAHTANVPPLSGFTVIGVTDPLSALQRLANHYRRKFDIPVVGVTGSVGKTTTKDLMAAVLAARFKTLKTEGNLNNEIGVPLMLTRLDSTYQAAVLEMGMSALGEIDLLARLALPKIGVITNIGESHLEMLGSREGIACAKCELLPHLPADGTAVVNADEPLLEPFIQNLRCRLLTFGFSEAATVRCTAVEENRGRKTVRIEQAGYPQFVMEPPLPGRHNIYNLMAALAVGRLLGLSDQEIIEGLKKVRLTGMRLEVIDLPAGYHVINDSYNASPTSMAAALDVLAEKAGTAGRIAVLGDMLELGDMEEEGHRRIGRLAAESSLRALLVLGERARLIAEGASSAGFPENQIYMCNSHAEAAALVRHLAVPGDWVLLKGSRGMRMEEVMAALAEG